jgi:hypothetical protein
MFSHEPSEECIMVYFVKGFGKILSTPINNAAALSKVLDNLTCKCNMITT